MGYNDHISHASMSQRPSTERLTFPDLLIARKKQIVACELGLNP